MTHFQPLSRIFVFQIYIVQKLRNHENRWVTKELRLGLDNLCFLLAIFWAKLEAYRFSSYILFVHE